MALQPIVSEMRIGGVWTDVTTLVQRDNGNGIRISRKPLSWAERVAPTTANWIFKNPNNDLYGRNPNSQYFGLLGRNTEVRHRLRQVYDTFTRTVSSGIGTSTSGHVWTAAGGTASDHSVTGAVGQTVFNTLNASYRWTAAITLQDSDTEVDFRLTQVPTGAAETGGLMARTNGSTDYIFTRFLVGTDASVTLEIAERVGGVNATLASIATGITYTNNLWLTGRLSVRGTRVRAMLWQTSDDPSTEWLITATTTITAAGQPGIRGQANSGNTNVSPTAQYDNFQVSSYRFWGEIPSFQPQRDSTGRYKTVPVTAAGLSQRLSAGTESLMSAMTRAMDGLAEGDIIPVAHWPAEETQGATTLSNLRQGSTGAATGSVTLGGYSYAGLSGIGSVPLLNDTGQLSGTYPAGVAQVGSGGESVWQVQFIGVVPSGMSANTTFFDINVANTGSDNIVKFRIEWDNGFQILTCRPYTNAGVALTGAAIDFSNAFIAAHLFNRPVLYGISLFQTAVGGAVAQQFSAYREESGGGNVQSSVNVLPTSTTVMPPQDWRAYGTSVNAGWSFSHHAYYTDPALLSVSNQQNNANALDGFNGEPAGTRMIRVSGESSIPFDLLGDEADTFPCGPQPAGRYIDIMVDAANVDQGVLQDARDRLALEYIPRVELENTTPLVTFSGTDTHDMQTFQLVDDDRTIRNKITARRTSGGAFAIAEITEGPASTAEPPDGIGVYPENLPWNLAKDSDLVAFAGWRALIKGVDAARYPATAIWRERSEIVEFPTLDAYVLAMDNTTHYVIADLPEDLPPDDVGLLVQGYEETIANFEHRITFDGQPSEPYTVIELDDDDGRADDDHFLRIAVNDDETAWEIGNSNVGMQIIADDAQDGWLWAMDGEVFQVTDVSPPTIAFVGVGTASSGSSGSRTPGLPASIATGHLALIFASTRNTTGVPQLATNWDQVYLDGNIAVYARIYDGSGAGFMPTITYSGGAANEDTIAQSMALSGKFHSTDQIIVRTVGCLNASAQDIYPGAMGITRLPENCFGIYGGWKQDDFTSVATPTDWTEAQEASSTAGNDASQVWGYRQFTSRPTVGSLSPSLVVTGGASAISRGFVMVIASDYQDVTVVRGINGIQKAHAANAIPRLVPAAHVAM